MVDFEGREGIQELEKQGVQRDREIADLSGRFLRLAATLEAVRAETAGRADSPAGSPNLSMPKPAVPSVPAPPSPHGSLRTSRRSSRSSAGSAFRCCGAAAATASARATFTGAATATRTLSRSSRTRRGTFWGRDAAGVGVARVGRQLQIREQLPQGRSESEEFFFTVKNPHNFPGRKFGLRAEAKDHAIVSSFQWVHTFGTLFDDCNTNTDSRTSGEILSVFCDIVEKDLRIGEEKKRNGRWERH
jgi:hypothetical protein